MRKEPNILNNALLLFLLSVFKTQMFKECIIWFLLERNTVQGIMWYSVYVYQTCQEQRVVRWKIDKTLCGLKEYGFELLDYVLMRKIFLID